MLYRAFPPSSRTEIREYVTRPWRTRDEQISGNNHDVLSPGPNLEVAECSLAQVGGKLQLAYSYDAYGNLDLDAARVHEPISSLAGQYFDSEIRLVYMRARYYDPGASEVRLARPCNKRYSIAVRIRWPDNPATRPIPPVCTTAAGSFGVHSGADQCQPCSRPVFEAMSKVLR